MKTTGNGPNPIEISPAEQELRRRLNDGKPKLVRSYSGNIQYQIPADPVIENQTIYNRYSKIIKLTPEEEAEQKEELEAKLKSIITQETSDEDIKSLIDGIFPFYQRHKDLAGKKVMVLFSGGLDTSFMAHILQHIIGAEVTTFTADVGSIEDLVNMENIEERSREVGAAQHICFDCKDMLEEVAARVITAEATLGKDGMGHHPASSLTRPVIVEAAMRYAKENYSDAILHGSNGGQNNPYRFKTAINHFKKILGIEIEELTPNLGGTTVSRENERVYLESMGISLKTAQDEMRMSMDNNRFGKEREEEELADTNTRYDVKKMRERNGQKGFQNTTPQPLEIAIRFEKGLPIALSIDGGEYQNKTLVEMIDTLNEIGLEYGIGIYDYGEDRPHGAVAREVHVSPALSIIISTRNWLRSFLTHGEAKTAYNHLSEDWSGMVMQENFYISPAREKIDIALEKHSQELNGEVKFTLEMHKVINITSEAANNLGDRNVAPATIDFNNRYVTKGVNPSKLESIDFHIGKLEITTNNKPQGKLAIYEASSLQTKHKKTEEGKTLYKR